MDNLSVEEENKLPQLIKKFKTNKEYYDFIINRGNSLMTNGKIQFSSHKTIKHAEDFLIWYVLFNRY
jgi:hypothetical protein